MKTTPIIINTDGGARGNPGPAAVGVIIADGDQIVTQISHAIGTATNNEAEYRAVLESLKFLSQNKTLISGRELEWRLDSLLIASQLTGKFKIKELRLKDLARQCLDLLDTLSSKYKIVHVPRHQNSGADKLVNQALDAQNLNAF